jgi:methanogen homocitrate synthase
MFYLTKKLRVGEGSDHGIVTMILGWQRPALFSVKGSGLCPCNLNGLGENRQRGHRRTAIAAKLYGLDFNIDMKKIYSASKLVEKISKIPISPLKPVIGENVFMRESGVTAAQLISYPPAVEGYSPEVLGRERGVLLSKKSGKRSVEYKLEKMNVKASPEQVDEVLKEVKSLGLKKKGLVSDNELKEIVKKVIK